MQIFIQLDEGYFETDDPEVGIATIALLSGMELEEEPLIDVEEIEEKLKKGGNVSDLLG